MNNITKVDMQELLRQLQRDLERVLTSRQATITTLTRMVEHVLTQMNEQQQMSRQVNEEVNRLSKRLPVVERSLSDFRSDLQSIVQR